MDYLRQIITWFQADSGLKINLRKCEIIPAREVDDIRSLARVLKCRVRALPTAYLGVPSFEQGFVIQRVEKKLAGW